ncbi:predicted protein [Botrytis cinerea T4]|uniref:Uncharacterized protein n=1 Tax=Botryotinia fuckeliana (strain T4) TaxID=999810 RepID=G2XX33_BOTF4|nr:predicted protein [Botrytis cinerea T4]
MYLEAGRSTKQSKLSTKIQVFVDILTLNGIDGVQSPSTGKAPLLSQKLAIQAQLRGKRMAPRELHLKMRKRT